MKVLLSALCLACAASPVDEYPDQTDSLFEPAQDDQSFRVPGRYVARGVVHAPAGTDLSGVPVAARYNSDVQGELDEEGRFELVFPFPGDYKLRFGERFHHKRGFFADEVAGLRVATPVHVQLSSDTPQVDVPVQLVAPGRISGRVVLSSGKEPPPNLSVEAHFSLWQPPDHGFMTWLGIGGTHWVDTEADGSFEFTTIHPDCLYDLEAALGGKSERKKRYLARSKGVPAGSHDHVLVVDDRLLTPVALRGRVIGSSSDAVTAFEVQFFLYEEDSNLRSFREFTKLPIHPVQDARGAFRFGMPRDIPEILFQQGGRLLALFSSSGRGQAILGPLNRMAMLEPHVVRLPDLVFPNGLVLGAEGEPVEGAEVRIFGPAQPFDGGSSASRLLASGNTGADGQFSSRQLSAGVLSLHVHAEQGETMVAIDAQRSWPVVDVVLETRPVDASLVLYFVNPRDRQMSGLEVSLVRECPSHEDAERITGTSDSAGSVTFQGLRPGMYLIEIAGSKRDMPYLLDVLPGTSEEHTVVVATP